MELWVGCIAGALRDTEYVDKLKAAGFGDVEVEPWRIYKLDDARAFLTEAGIDVDRIAPLVEDTFASALVRARKPEATSCCGPECCS
jgi:arsenite methyltransferase